MAKEKYGLGNRLKIGNKKPIASEKKIDDMVKMLGNEKEKVIKTSIHYPEGLYKKMRIKIATEGTTIRDYILNLIEKDLLSDS